MVIGFARRKRDSAPFLTPETQTWVRSIDPRTSFKTWSGARPLSSKRSRTGLIERFQLIETVWPGERDRLIQALDEYHGWRTADLHDAFAALWTARRIAEAGVVAAPSQTAFQAAR